MPFMPEVTHGHVPKGYGCLHPLWLVRRLRYVMALACTVAAWAGKTLALKEQHMLPLGLPSPSPPVQTHLP